MDKIKISLLPKQLAFIQRSLEAQILEYEYKIASKNCTEDEISDMENDLILMKPTLDELKKINPI